MKKSIIIAIILCMYGAAAHAQQHIQDTMLSVTLNNTDIKSQRIMNDSLQKVYNKMCHDLSRILPYLTRISDMYKDANTRFGKNGENVKAKRKYMNSQEAILRKEYKDKLKDLTISQGQLLTLLISRQTGTTTYQLLKEYENGFTAFKWQALSSFFSYNLKQMYDPAENPMLEGILYKWGYALPVYFTQNNPSAREY